jgi:hypothetical protein
MARGQRLAFPPVVASIRPGRAILVSLREERFRTGILGHVQLFHHPRRIRRARVTGGVELPEIVGGQLQIDGSDIVGEVFLFPTRNYDGRNGRT